MLGTLMGQVNRMADSQRRLTDHGVALRGSILPSGVVNSMPFGASAMNIIGLGIDRLRLKLRIMSDDDLWWLFLHHREECSPGFWEELETRKAAGTLSKDSPFWAMDALTRCPHPRSSGDNSNLIKLTPEEWEARRRRKMFRLISA